VKTGLQRLACIRHADEAAVEPDLELGRLAPDRADDLAMSADTGDRIEIGDIDAAERGEVEQAAQDCRGSAAGRERRDDRMVVGAVAGAGAHDMAALEVENRYDRERGHGGAASDESMREGAYDVGRDG
jgi:hypothetical protein